MQIDELEKFGAVTRNVEENSEKNYSSTVCTICTTNKDGEIPSYSNGRAGELLGPTNEITNVKSKFISVVRGGAHPA